MQKFSIPGKPTAKGRPRFAGGHAYTDSRTANYEALVGWYARAANIQKIKGPVRIVVTAYWPCPKAKERVTMPYPGEWKVSRPDIDNILKIVCDGLNGIAWEDDAQVVIAVCSKRIAAQGKEARVDIQMEEANGHNT